MKANDIFELLFDGIERMSPTADGLISGDGEREAGRIVTCHKLTFELLEHAKEAGADMIITHEPPYVDGNYPGAHIPVDVEKSRRIAESGIAVYRFHDHAHAKEFDYIHEAFIRAVGLRVAERDEQLQLGVRRYVLEEPTTARELGEKCREALCSRHPRVAGSADHAVRSVILALGGIGYHQIKLLANEGFDLIVTGELNEVLELEHVKDICWLCGEKAVLLLGHYTAEFMGMRLVAERLRTLGFDALALDSGEVWE
jgi:putative NIF3 family GTP cyclohydrolase 1 type 2